MHKFHSEILYKQPCLRANRTNSGRSRKKKEEIPKNSKLKEERVWYRPLAWRGAEVDAGTGRSGRRFQGPGAKPGLDSFRRAYCGRHGAESSPALRLRALSAPVLTGKVLKASSDHVGLSGCRLAHMLKYCAPSLGEIRHSV